MRTFAAMLVPAILSVVPVVYADTVNYDQLIRQFVVERHTQTFTKFTVDKVVKFSTEVNDVPGDSLAMWVTVSLPNHTQQRYIILIGAGRIYGFKSITEVKQETPEPQCTPEEHREEQS